MTSDISFTALTGTNTPYTQTKQLTLHNPVRRHHSQQTYGLGMLYCTNMLRICTAHTLHLWRPKQYATKGRITDQFVISSISRIWIDRYFTKQLFHNFKTFGSEKGLRLGVFKSYKNAKDMKNKSDFSFFVHFPPFLSLFPLLFSSFGEEGYSPENTAGGGGGGEIPPLHPLLAAFTIVSKKDS